MRARLLLSLLTLLVSSTLYAQSLPLSRSAHPRRLHQSDHDSTTLSRSSRSAESSHWEESINVDLFEGDIVLTEGQNPYQQNLNKREAMMMPQGEEFESGSGESVPVTLPEESDPVTHPKAYQNRNDLWEGGKVLFKYDHELTTAYRTLVDEAIDMWKAAVGDCITFEEAKEGAKDFILFRKVSEEEGGCSSYIGRIGGMQFLNFSSECNKAGNIAHEIGHAIGMWHEHSRPDRDEFIKVNFNNILTNQHKNFGKISRATFSKVPPVSYDVESIMHYGAGAFANNQDATRPSIEVLESATWDMCDDPERLGQRDGLSYKDVLRVKLLYGCGKVTPTDMPKTCPTPTPTKTTPSPEPTKRYFSGNQATIRSFDGSEGMRCVATSCTPTPCSPVRSAFGYTSHCDNVENQFVIVKIVSDETVNSTEQIYSGDTVALRSVSKNTFWLDCTSPGKLCKITTCEKHSDNTTTTCDKHFFTINGVTIRSNGKTRKVRAKGKVFSTRHFAQLQHVNDSHTYLNCTERQCKLVAEEQNFNITLTATR